MPNKVTEIKTSPKVTARSSIAIAVYGDGSVMATKWTEEYLPVVVNLAVEGQ